MPLRPSGSSRIPRSHPEQQVGSTVRHVHETVEHLPVGPSAIAGSFTRPHADAEDPVVAVRASSFPKKTPHALCASW